jgi:hypothetical protein
MLTLETFLWFLMTNPGASRAVKRQEAMTTSMSAAIKAAESAAAERLFRFIAKETAGAFVFHAFARLRPDEKAGQQMKQRAFDCFA